MKIKINEKTKNILIWILTAVLTVTAFFGVRHVVGGWDCKGVEGKPAANFTVLNKNMEEVSLSDKKGKPVVINFWATWCSPCKAELPAFEKMYKKYKGEVEFMMVNLTYGNNETVAKVRKFIQENGYTFPVYYDTQGKAADTYEVSAIRLTLFINADGNIVHTYNQAISETALQGYIKDILD